MTSRYYSSTATDTALTSAITSGSGSMTVASTIGWPTSYPFTLALDYNTALEELVDVTAVTGLTVTITRGADSTAPTAHGIGAVVRHVVTARDARESNVHINTTTGAHPLSAITGFGTNVATFLATPSSTNLATAVTGETGSGALVFGTSPTITTPTITTPAITGGTLGSSTISGSTITSTTIDYSLNTITNLPSPTAAVLTFNAYSGAANTLVAADAYKLVTVSNATTTTLTVPLSTFTAGQYINVQQVSTGNVTIVGASGVTITSAGGTSASPILRANQSAATIICTATNIFTVVGDII